MRNLFRSGRDKRAPSPGRPGEEIRVAWIWLIVGGFCEVGFTTCLRFVNGFRNVVWTAGFLASVTLSMGLLEVASRSIAMGTAYAVWGGIGALGTVLVGMIWFGEPVNPIRIALIVALVGCIAGLKLTH
jgi:quaternary ammonium compound-resistance protein SugE